MDGNLGTTNLLLGIMAAVSVIEALLIVAGGIFAYRIYANAMRTIRDLETRHIAPLAAKVEMTMGKVDGILVDVKAITARIGDRTERVDTALRHTIERVDETADRMRSSVASHATTLVGVVNGVRNVVGTLFNGRRHAGETSEHADAGAGTYREGGSHGG